MKTYVTSDGCPVVVFDDVIQIYSIYRTSRKTGRTEEMYWKRSFRSDVYGKEEALTKAIKLRNKLGAGDTTYTYSVRNRWGVRVD